VCVCVCVRVCVCVCLKGMCVVCVFVYGMCVCVCVCVCLVCLQCMHLVIPQSDVILIDVVPVSSQASIRYALYNLMLQKAVFQNVA
jgi:hypothetical protein